MTLRRAPALLAVFLLQACRSIQTAPLAPAPRLSVPGALTHSELTPRQKAEHVLNRLGFGPRPGEVDALAQGGDAAIWAYVLAQLHPEHIADAATDREVAVLPTAALSNGEIRRGFLPVNEVAKQRGVDVTDDEAMQRLKNELDPDQSPGRVEEDLLDQKLVRAIQSSRQLQEALVDFWFNHFNVDIDKGEVRWMTMGYERDAIRPHLFGRFRDLLGAVAHTPAMLYYLDNWQSVREQPVNPKRPNAPTRGLNENYARELMELHTLGVNGGYTQADVREAARCLSGWTIDQPREQASFVFREKDHDEGPKTVLGVRFPPNGGQADGEKLLDLLAARPATARFIAHKLARHFVSDDPPPALEDRLARRFLDTHGDLREVYLALFASPEFWSKESYRSKVKTPLEMAVSAVRDLDGHLDLAGPLANEIARMGERLYRRQPPTGYPDVAADWVSTGALVERLNFSLRLSTGRVGGVHGHFLPFVPGRRRADASRFIEVAADSLLHGDLTPETREVLLAELSIQSRTMPDGELRPLDAPKLAGLLLGSPEFQRR